MLWSMLRPTGLGRLRQWQPYSWSREPFKARPWPGLLDRYWDLADRYPEQLAMVEILHSVVDSDAANRLAGNYTIGGLHVVDVEHREPPYSVITVETYGRSNKSEPLVAVWHVSSSGLREEIIRPVDSAVALFWRFVAEKFSIPRRHPRRSGAEPTPLASHPGNAAASAHPLTTPASADHPEVTQRGSRQNNAVDLVHATICSGLSEIKRARAATRR
jgi:hypothetical protein